MVALRVLEEAVASTLEDVAFEEKGGIVVGAGVEAAVVLDDTLVEFRDTVLVGVCTEYVGAVPVPPVY